MSATYPERAPDTVLRLYAHSSAQDRRRLALADALDGLRLWRLALTLGWLDIKLRYRGSVLGPFWLTLSTAVMVGSMGVIYATLFHMNLREYLPFLALSLVLWGFLSGLAMDGCTAFLQAEGMIRSARMPFFVHAMRIMVRNVLTLGHNIAVIVVVFVAFQIWPGARGWLVIPGFALWLLDGLAVAVLLGAFCARFRDIPPIVSSILQIALFASAVIWKPEQLGAKVWVLLYNPFFTLLEIVRAPLLGEATSLPVWLSALVSSVVLWLAAGLLFARVRNRLAFWV